MTDKFAGTAPSDDILALAIMKQVERDDMVSRLFGGMPVKAVLCSPPNGEKQIKINDPVFPTTLPLSQLREIARSVPNEKEWGLLARPGILDVAAVVLEKTPDSFLTLSDAANKGGQAVLMYFDINGHDIRLCIEQDRRRKRDGKNAAKIRGEFDVAPEAAVGTSLGRWFTVRGLEEFSLLADEGLGYCARVLDSINGLDRPAFGVKDFIKRLTP